MSDNIFGEEKEQVNGIEWDWKNFETTEDYPVSPHLLDWVIGQPEPLSKIRLAINTWIHKLLWIKKEGRLERKKRKPTEDAHTKSEKLPPGPYLLMLGDPGTGKTLIGRAMAAELTEIYKEHNVVLTDVLCHPNPLISSEPIITVHPTPEGKRILRKEKIKADSRGKWTRYIVFGLLGILIAAGFLCISMAVGGWIRGITNWIYNVPTTYNYVTKPVRDWFNHNFSKYLREVFMGQVQLLSVGAGLAIFPVFILIIGRGLIGGALKGIGGASQSKAPKLLVDNSENVAPFKDATGHSSPQLFGSVTWDPYQSGGLGTPEHQRTNAGDVHKAHLGILYIDEIKNLKPFEAVTLLTVLEEGELPIAHRGETRSGTSALSLATDPVPSLCLLLAAGNFDSIYNIHPALMDRIRGYGSVIRMNNDMPNTVENRRKVGVQFVAQELKRFHYQPFHRSACEELVRESRRRSGWNDRLTCRFRPMIDIILKSSQLAKDEGSEYTMGKHVKDALKDHCKTIQKQLLEHAIKERGKLLQIEPEGAKLGVIYGLAVSSWEGEKAGMVSRVKGTLKKKSQVSEEKTIKGYYEATGVAKDGKWIDDSLAKVRNVIIHKENVDIAQHYFSFIDFSQAQGVDGPSAGITMTLLMISLLKGKKLRQDVTVTGEINISSEDRIEVTPVGGLHEKISASQALGFKKVCIPQKNFDHSINPDDYEIEVVGCATLSDYLDHILVNE